MPNSGFPAGTGVGIDMVTLQPVEKKTAEDQEAERRRRRQDMEERAQFLAIPRSEAGQLVVAEVEKQMLSRIKALLKDDPVAQNLLGLLKKLNYRTDQAQRAWNALQEEYLPSWNAEATGASDTE